MGGGPSCASYGTRISPEPVTAGGIGGGGGGGVKERNSYIVFKDSCSGVGPDDGGDDGAGGNGGGNGGVLPPSVT